MAATASSSQFDDLKDIVSKTLEKQGILAKAQAQLRKHVFEALSNTEQKKPTKYNLSPQIDVNDRNDQFAMALIRDFLEYHHLDYTLSLMNTESQKKMEVTQSITRNAIASRLGLGAQKPNPDCSLLNQLVKQLFENDIFQPRNSTLSNDITLKPRTSTDSYRSSLDSTSFPLMNKDKSTNNKHDQSITEDERYNTVNNVLQNLELKLPKTKELPPLPIRKKQKDTLDAGEISQISNIAIDVDELLKESMEIDTTDVNLLHNIVSPQSEANNTEAYTDPMDDVLDELLESSSNDNQDENVKPGLLASELAKLEKKSVLLSHSAVSSQTATEITDYEDDFGSDLMEQQETNEENNDNNSDIIEEDIDEEIDEESVSISVDIEDEDDTDNIYAATDLDQATNDESISKNTKLEHMADIIMDVETEQIKYQFS